MPTPSPARSPRSSASSRSRPCSTRPAIDKALLLVDNCEHLLEAAARTIGRILEVCEQPTVLATSRSPLELPGESVVALAPLEVPAVDTLSASVSELPLGGGARIGHVGAVRTGADGAAEMLSER